MNFNKRLSAKDIKTGIDNLSNLGGSIGNDTTLYIGMVEGINSKMNIDVEECFSDSYKKEALIAETIIQNLSNGVYVDISEAQNLFHHEHWNQMVVKYANKYDV